MTRFTVFSGYIAPYITMLGRLWIDTITSLSVIIVYLQLLMIDNLHWWFNNRPTYLFRIIALQ